MASRGYNAAAAAASTAAKNRKHYLHLLRESAREASVFSSRATTAAAEGMTTPSYEGSSVGSSSRISSHEANLHLPEGWAKRSTERLQTSLEGIISPETVLRSDWFLCALIHPSFVRSRSARAGVAMPMELSLTGSSTLRLLKEVTALHGISGFFQKDIASIPRGLGVEELVLYDRALFEEDCQRLPPEEVRMAAATALCGAVTLTGGINSSAKLLDRLLELEAK